MSGANYALPMVTSATQYQFQGLYKFASGPKGKGASFEVTCEISIVLTNQASFSYLRGGSRDDD